MTECMSLERLTQITPGWNAEVAHIKSLGQPHNEINFTLTLFIK